MSSKQKKNVSTNPQTTSSQAEMGGGIGRELGS